MEADILLWIQNNFRNDLLTPVMRFITYLGEKGFLFILVALIFLFIKNTRKTGITVGAGLLLNLLVSNGILKHLFNRVRPYEVIEGLTILIEKQPDTSFPSGHASAAFAFAAVLLLRMPKAVSVPATVLAVLIGFSRMYLGVHYPTDVLCGAVIGFLCGAFAVYAVDALYKKYTDRKTGEKTK